MPNPVESVKSTDGALLTYERSGAGPPLLLVHGSLSNRSSQWFAIKPLVEVNFTVIAVDRRGRGESFRTEGHSLAQEQEDVAAIAQAVGEPVFALGHSYGGLCVLGAALVSPSRFRKIVAYEAPWTGTRTTTLAQHMPALQEDLVRGDADGCVYRFITDVLTVPRADADMVRKSPFWAPFVADAAASLQDWQAMLGYEFRPDRFKDLPPTLLITGVESPREMYVTDSILATLSNAREVAFPGQAHFAHVMDAPRFAEEITRFLLA